MSKEETATIGTLWQTMGGGNGRLGRTSRVFPLPAQLERTLPMRGSVSASPVFDREENVYLADMSGEVQAYSAGGGSLWQRDLEEGIYATPALNPEGNVLYVGTIRGNVAALNATDGAVLWRTNIVQKNDPRILADLLYLPQAGWVVTSSWQEEYAALNATSGEKQFTWRAGSTPRAAASATSDETLYYVRTESSGRGRRGAGIALERMQPAKREESRVFFHAGAAGARDLWASVAPVIDEEHKRVYVITNIDRTGILHALSLETGEEAWSQSYERILNAPPAVAQDGSVIVGDLFGSVIGYDLQGAKKFEYKTGSMFVLSGPVCDQQDRVFVADNEGKIHRVSMDGKGEVMHEAERSIQGRPAFNPSGKLYVPCTDGKVYVMV